MGSQKTPTESEFSPLQFEKMLTNLKDSQDSINTSCQWCLANRQHYKKIVSCWLNVIKRVKIEQRLTLFYLANDVVQYSKRRNYEYIDTWGTAIQKATTLVRDEKVKHKILRIFKIWEQRGVYGEEFIADLCGLISIQPTGPKNDEPHEFQASYVINKIKKCATLEKDTDAKLKMLKEHNPKIQISEGLITSLKDRAHVDDVEKEMDVYVQHMEDYINALKVEIKNRIALISALKQAETQLEADRKDVKVVAHAYKTFGQRVKSFQKKLEEHMEKLPSPVPSPDINAPSPSPEEDLELPEEPSANKTLNTSADNSTDFSLIQFSNPGFYVPPPTNASLNSTVLNNSNLNSSANTTDSNLTFLSNGFTSFLGQNISMDISNISASGLFPNSLNENATINNSTHTTNSYVTAPTAVVQPPLPVEAPTIDLTGSSSAGEAVYNPLLPPPMPPFSKNNESGAFSFSTTMDSTTNYGDSSYQTASYNEAGYSTEAGVNSEPNTGYYDPADAGDVWENVENSTWSEIKDIDTPESPPMFEKKGYGDPVEYHDSSIRSGAVDVDQRVLPGMGDLEDSVSSLGGKDVDHRNLISLTGSPSETAHNGAKLPVPSLPQRGNLKTITPQDSLWDNMDKDYRNPPPPLPPTNKDQDYRMQFNLDNLSLPPPPPPPKSPDKKSVPPPPPMPTTQKKKSPRKGGGDILGDEDDMDLSDDLDQSARGEHFSLEPPPPLPVDLLDDVDANQFLDEISNDLNDFSNLSSEFNGPPPEVGENSLDNSNMWHSGPPPLMCPPPMGFGIGHIDVSQRPPGLLPPPGPPMPPSWMGGSRNMTPSPEHNSYEDSHHFNNYQNNNFFGGGGGGGFKQHRGGGGSPYRGFNKGGDNFQGFRGRGRGGRGGRGGNQRGNRGQFRPRGFRGR